MNKNRKFLLFLSVICLLVIMLQAEKVSSGPATEIVITGFLEGSSLQTAGADIGDILIEYNGQKIKDIQHLGALKEGVTTERVDVVLQRNKKLIKVNIPAGQLGVYLRAFYPDHKFDRDAVIIPDIGRLDWNIGMENSFLAAVYRIDEKLGSNMSYQDMVGISGYGFRLHFFDGWCPSSPDATCGYLCGDELLQDLGYDFTTYLLEGTEVDEDYQDALRSADELSTIIKTSIDNGWPVIALDLIEVPEWGIITGYQKNGKELICRTYFDKTRDYDIAEKTPWVIYVINNKKVTDIEPLYRKSLVTARKLYNTPAYGQYFSGIRALQEWTAALENEEAFSAMTPEALSEAFLANWWIYYSLLEARKITIAYLENNLEKFGLKTATIQKIADIYREEVAILKEGFDAIPSPHTGSDLTQWTTEAKTNQVKLLKEMLAKERQVNLILLAM